MPRHALTRQGGAGARPRRRRIDAVPRWCIRTFSWRTLRESRWPGRPKGKGQHAIERDIRARRADSGGRGGDRHQHVRIAAEASDAPDHHHRSGAHCGNSGFASARRSPILADDRLRGCTAGPFRCTTGSAGAPCRGRLRPGSTGWRRGGAPKAAAATATRRTCARGLARFRLSADADLDRRRSSRNGPAGPVGQCGGRSAERRKTGSQAARRRQSDQQAKAAEAPRTL
jgi:hypothetical protein